MNVQATQYLTELSKVWKHVIRDHEENLKYLIKKKLRLREAIAARGDFQGASLQDAILNSAGNVKKETPYGSFFSIFTRSTQKFDRNLFEIVKKQRKFLKQSYLTLVNLAYVCWYSKNTENITCCSQFLRKQILYKIHKTYHFGV